MEKTIDHDQLHQPIFSKKVLKFGKSPDTLDNYDNDLQIIYDNIVIRGIFMSRFQIKNVENI